MQQRKSTSSTNSAQHVTSDIPTDSSYVNISSYQVQPKSYIEDNTYVNVNTRNSKNTANSRNSTHIPPKIYIFGNDDDSDYNCEEIGNPQKNYHILDFRKSPLKKPNNYMTSSANFTKPNDYDDFHAIASSWRRRSSTENCGLHGPKLQNIIYADLVINNLPSGKYANGYAHNGKDNGKQLDQLDYAQIDMKKTQALEDIDNELENLRTSKISKSPYRLKMQSVNTMCHRLINTVKNVRKNKNPMKN